MDFTELYKQTLQLVAFSPGSNFILTAVQDTLIVRRADTLQVTRSWSIDSALSPTLSVLAKAKPTLVLTKAQDRCITHIGWSCDSEYLFGACAKAGVVHVFKLQDEEWSARIDAGAEGLIRAEWAPDGRTILCFSGWGLRVSIWSIATNAGTSIQFPIHPDRGYAFRADGRYFILAERHKSKDTLGVYDTTQAYRLVRHFPLPTTSLASLAISPTGDYLAIWEGALEYKLYIYSLAGYLQATFVPSPDPYFGVRSVAWHPSGNFLAVSGWDDKVHILNKPSWSPVSTLELSNRIPVGVTFWREPPHWLETQGRGFLSYERLTGPQTINVTRSDPTKSVPKSGAVQLEWNKSGIMLLIRWENHLNGVHLYAFPDPEGPLFAPALRSVLVHSKPVLRARWNPARKGSLALCCGSRSVYTWSDEWVAEGPFGEEEEVAECIGVPAKKFEARDFRWSPDGKGLILMDKDSFCCAFEVEGEVAS